MWEGRSFLSREPSLKRPSTVPAGLASSLPLYAHTRAPLPSPPSPHLKPLRAPLLSDEHRGQLTSQVAVGRASGDGRVLGRREDTVSRSSLSHLRTARHGLQSWLTQSRSPRSLSSFSSAVARSFQGARESFFTCRASGCSRDLPESVSFPVNPARTVGKGGKGPVSSPVPALLVIIHVKHRVERGALSTSSGREAARADVYWVSAGCPQAAIKALAHLSLPPAFELDACAPVSWSAQAAGINRRQTFARGSGGRTSKASVAAD